MNSYEDSTPYEENGEGYGEGAQPTDGTWIQCFDEESGYPYVYNNITGETKWIDAESSNDLMVTLWQKFYDDSGDAFYYNPVSSGHKIALVVHQSPSLNVLL